MQHSKSQDEPGSLVFIIKTANSGDRDGGDRVGGVAKSAINAHVARLSHQKRRSQRERQGKPETLVGSAIRKPWTDHPLPPSILSQETGPSRDVQNKGPGNSNFQAAPLLRSGNGQGHTQSLGSETGSLSSDNPNGRQSESPLSMLQKGNSDPFDSFAIAIDAWANRFMDFGRTFLIPALYQSGKRGWVPSSPAARNWHAGVRDLSDECAAFGLMAYYATALTIVSGDASAARRALALKTKAVELLRAHMSIYLEHHLYIDTNLQGLIFRLFRAEILGRNPGAALVHGNMLRSGLERQSAAGTMDLGFLSVCIYHDNHRSSAFMARPIFDYEEFVPKAFAAVWKMLPLRLAEDTWDKIEEPDPSVTDPILRRILSEMRPFFFLYSLMATTRQTSASPTNWFWFLSQSETFQGRLINRYLDLMADPERKSMDATYIANIQLQACICLAALFTIRSPTSNPIVAGIPLYDSASTILKHLLEGLTTIETFQLYDQDTLSSNTIHDDALLWTYYVGALAEMRHPREPRYKKVFESGLSRKIAEMDIGSWEQLVSILRRFLYSDTYCAPCETENWFRMVRASTAFAVHGR